MAVGIAAEIARVQRGVVSRAQLRERGVGDGAIDSLMKRGQLHAIHRGVFAFGHCVLPPLGAETAALLACGSGAVLSHRTAAALWGLIDDPPRIVDVTMVGAHARRHSGIHGHRTRALARREIRIRDGLPVTDPERTLLDLSAVVPRAELEAAVDRGRARRMVRERRLRSLITSMPRRRGAGALGAALQTPGFSRSEAERRLLALIRRAGLPEPQRNARVAGYEVDLWWPRQRVAVEIDGYAFHSDREAFEADRRRDAELAAVGVRTVRITWRRLSGAPAAIVAELALVLESSSWPPISQSFSA